MTRADDDDVDFGSCFGIEGGCMVWLGGAVWFRSAGSDFTVVRRLSLRTIVGSCCWAEEGGVDRRFGVEKAHIAWLGDCTVGIWTAGSRFTVVT